MKHALVLAVVVIGMTSSRSEASCINVVEHCFCAQGGGVAFVVTESFDGGTAAVRVESSPTGVDAGVVFEFPTETDEAVGARWLLLNGKRRAIDAQGLVGCPDFAVTARLPAEDVATAAAGSSCFQDIEALGFKQPPCNDTGPRCAVSPLLMPLLALAGLLRRRQRSQR